MLSSCVGGNYADRVDLFCVDAVSEAVRLKASIARLADRYDLEYLDGSYVSEVLELKGARAAEREPVTFPEPVSLVLRSGGRKDVTVVVERRAIPTGSAAISYFYKDSFDADFADEFTSALEEAAFRKVDEDGTCG